VHPAATAGTDARRRAGALRVTIADIADIADKWREGLGKRKDSRQATLALTAQLTARRRLRPPAASRPRRLAKCARPDGSKDHGRGWIRGSDWDHLAGITESERHVEQNQCRGESCGGDSPARTCVPSPICLPQQHENRDRETVREKGPGKELLPSEALESQLAGNTESTDGEHVPDCR